MKHKNNQNNKPSQNILKIKAQRLIHQNALYTIIAIFFGFLVGGIFRGQPASVPLKHMQSCSAACSAVPSISFGR